MELSLSEVMESLERLGTRLEAAVTALEGTAARPTADGEGEVGKITASVEGSARELELERRLAGVEHELAAARAAAPATEAAPSGRKTLPAATVQLLAKSGLTAGESVDVAALDAALTGMSVEERIAVKSQMWRVGTLVV